MTFVLGGVSLLAGLLAFVAGMVAGSESTSDKGVVRAASISLALFSVALVAAYVAGRLA